MNKVTVCIAILLAVVCVGAGATSYTITDIGTLGGESTWIADINSLGQVVGTSQTGERKWVDNSNGSYWSYQSHAFIWLNGVMTNISTPEVWYSSAHAINDAGQVVGDFGLWQNGSLTQLDVNPADINNNGNITENHWITGPAFHAYLLSNDTSVDLGNLGGRDCAALGINDLDEVVGYSDTSGPPDHAFLWSSGVMTDLGTLPGFGHSGAWAINNSTEVVGTSYYGNAGAAFLWQNGSMVSLGTLGGNWSNALDINNLGQVVGLSRFSASDENHAFLVDNGAMYDLNNLIAADSGWELMDAQAINDSGLIVANGIYNGVAKACILTPVPEPSSVVVLAVGLVGLIGIRRRRA